MQAKLYNPHYKKQQKSLKIYFNYLIINAIYLHLL
jgi:hypothetical protein